MNTEVFALRNVDYSERGMELEIIVEEQRKLQTVIYGYNAKLLVTSGRWWESGLPGTLKSATMQLAQAS